MSNGHHIRAVGRDAAQDAPSPTDAEASGAEAGNALDLGDFESDAVDEEPYEPAARQYGWVAPTLAILAIAAWSGFYGWAVQSQLLAAATSAPSEWVRLIIDWSVPVLLIGVVWLIAMRNSRAEASRFAQSAALLSRESAELESRLTVVNRELSLAREFLGAQSLELESLGRIASERISTHAAELQTLIKSNGAQVEAIGSASETALANMTRLRDDLPVVANAARDVSNQVGNAGRNAQEQLEKLVTGFERLNQFGKASEAQVQSFDKRVGTALSGYSEQLDAIASALSARIENVREEAGTFRSQVDETEAAALEALRERLVMLEADTGALAEKLRAAETAALEQLHDNKTRFEQSVTQTVAALDRLDQQALLASQRRVAALHEEAGRFDDRLSVRDRRFAEEMARRQEEFDTREAQASEVLAQRLAGLDDALAERREAQMRETEKLVAQGTAMSEQIDRLATLIGEAAQSGDNARLVLGNGLETLGKQLAEKQAALRETEAQLAGLTEAGIRLLEIIQSGAKHSREDLPKAIASSSDALGTVEQRVSAVSSMMLGTGAKAESLGDYLIEAQAKIEVADTSLDALQSRLAEQTDEALAKLQGLRTGLQRLAQESEGFAGETQGTLRASLAELEAATGSAFSALEQGAREKVDTLAATLSRQVVTELERSLQSETAETLSKLELAVANASGAGREATVQLRDQLAKVNELTKNLEQRVARARELAEEQVGNDFARRMALITDSLNSHAIDIAAALSTEVADTAWDAYLKGDRGIFTRRAVRLIDNGEAREIADLYQRDETFKAGVSRYIHDFEAMLRAMLSTRDGNALGVTILGSDMGKLYVALAQAIERFRQ